MLNISPRLEMKLFNTCGCKLHFISQFYKIELSLKSISDMVSEPRELLVIFLYFYNFKINFHEKTKILFNKNKISLKGYIHGC